MEKQDKERAATATELQDGYCGLVKHVLLLLFTFGIWQLVWVYKTTGYLNQAKGEEYRSPTSKLLLYMFVPFYSIYWIYKSAQRIDKMAAEKGLNSELSTLCLILAIFIPFIALILMQDKINAIATISGTSQGAGSSTLFSLPENLYFAGAPVIIAAGELQKDNQTGKVFAQLKLHNIQNKVIKAITVTLALNDTAARPLGEVDYQYLDLTADREADFGQETPIMLENANTRSFSVKIKEIIYADNSTWTDAGEAWEPLAPARTLEDTLGDMELAKQFRLEYGPNCKYELTRGKDLWHCSCGAFNHEDEAACVSCGLPSETLENVDLEALAANKDERLVREKAAADERGKKIKKLVIIGVATVVVIIVAGVVISKINHVREINENFAEAAQDIADGNIENATYIYDRLIRENDTPEMRYRVAEAYLENGLYDNATEAFEELGDYEDSTERAKSAKYQSVVNYIEEGIHFSTVKETLESLQDYQDSEGLMAYMPYVGHFECKEYFDIHLDSDFYKKDGKLYLVISNFNVGVGTDENNEPYLTYNPSRGSSSTLELSDSMEASLAVGSFRNKFSLADGKITYNVSVVDESDPDAEPHEFTVVYERVEE